MTPQLIAHRGDATTGYTEESLNSFVIAAQENADAIELDVQLSSDGVMFCMHDATLDRTTTSTGEIGTMTSAQVKLIRLNDGSPIPTLPEVLAAVKKYPVDVLIEMKSQFDDAAYIKLKSTVLAFGSNRCNINSFSTGRLKAYHALAPNQRIMLNSNVQRSVATVAPYGAICIPVSQLTQTYRVEMQEANLKVLIYEADDIASWKAGKFCDGIITNDVPGFLTWLGT